MFYGIVVVSKSGYLFTTTTGITFTLNNHMDIYNTVNRLLFKTIFNTLYYYLKGNADGSVNLTTSNQ